MIDSCIFFSFLLFRCGLFLLDGLNIARALPVGLESSCNLVYANAGKIQGCRRKKSSSLYYDFTPGKQMAETKLINDFLCIWTEDIAVLRKSRFLQQWVSTWTSNRLEQEGKRSEGTRLFSAEGPWCTS